MREEIIRLMADKKIIAIVRGISDREKCIRLAEALLKGGICLIEVTFNQSAPKRFSDTLSAISEIDRVFGSAVSVGAGTVLTTEQVIMAESAGAKYIISPNTSVSVIEKTRDLGLVSIPGAMTPTEITLAASAGADIVKLFPAGILGTAYINAIRAPLNHVRLLATGGIDARNIPELLTCGCFGFGVGGNLVNKEWIESGQFERITLAAREICDAADV